MPDLHMFTREFWDERYRTRDKLWSGRPNAQLIEQTQDLVPGRAIDVGCGEGADVIWLAQRGWTVTGLDVSPVALARAAAHAEQAGAEIAQRIEWREGDLFGEPLDLGQYDLVSSHYLHAPAEVRGAAVTRLAAAVGAGGSLLLVSHHPSDLEIPGLRPNRPELFYTAEELAAQLDAGEWEIVTAAAPERSTTGPDGQPVTIRDTVLRARRRGEAPVSDRAGWPPAAR